MVLRLDAERPGAIVEPPLRFFHAFVRYHFSKEMSDEPEPHSG